jgi:signal transduction histidine kinase/ligand-binding sensor domain-containing protein
MALTNHVAPAKVAGGPPKILKIDWQSDAGARRSTRLQRGSTSLLRLFSSPFNRWARWPIFGWMVLLLISAAHATRPDSGWFARVWQSDDGLPNNRIYGLAQTMDGYLWIATPIGLVRFDGSRFEAISSTQFVAAPNRGIHALHGTRSGGLWVGMDRGSIVGMDGTARVISPSDGLPDLIPQTLIEDDEGGVWIAYIGGAIYWIKGDKITAMTPDRGPAHGAVASVARDAEGRVWLARGGEVGLILNGQFESRLCLENATICLGTALNGGIWICHGQRLLRYDGASPPTENGTIPADRSDVQPTVVFEDREGAVWVGTSYGGLFRHNGARFENVPTSHPAISSLLEDREGNLWAGTVGGGLNCLRPRAALLEGVDTGLPFETVRSVCEDAAGALWATTTNGLVVRRSRDGWSTVSGGPDWPGSIATCVAADPSGAVWIGTRNRRLIRWNDGRFEQWDKGRGVIPAQIYALLASSSGSLWIGGQNPDAVQCLDQDRLRSLELPVDARMIRAMAEDAEGNIWVGTSRGILMRVSGGRLLDETSLTSAPLKSIRCLHATPDGSLWIGYAGWGVGRLRNGRFALIGTEQGLFDDYISQIVADGHGWLWFGSDHGIFKVRQRELDDLADGRTSRVRSIHYGPSEGLRNLQADFGCTPGVLHGRDGRLWMPTGSGLAVVDPRKLGDDSAAPPVLLKRVALDEKTLAVHSGVIPAGNIAELRKPLVPARLSPRHRKLEFEFTALSFTAPENVRIQRRLDGFDEDWIDAGALRSATYPRLPAGNYRFRVRACNGDGAWNEEGAVFAFLVAPFFWQTWWFRLSALAGFTCLVVAIARYVSFRRLRSQLHSLEQQASVDRERARIARDLHDDLGSRLTRIVLLGDLMQDGCGGPGSREDGAVQIATAARQVIKSLDETVWAINPRNDTLPNLIDYLGQFAVEFLRTARIRCRVDLPAHPDDHAVSTEMRHNLFLVVKEALNNVVRHANASEVQLRMDVTESSIELVVQDDGCGFAYGPDRAGADGLRNMRQRVEDLGGRFEVNSEPGSGTRISAVVPWNRAGRSA